MMNHETIAEIKDAKAAYESALKSKFAVEAKKRTYMNLLMNHAEELLETALDAEYLLSKKAEAEKEAKRLAAELKKATATECDAEQPSRKNG